jgi:succinoglycan biosynthesis protein ExoH
MAARGIPADTSSRIELLRVTCIFFIVCVHIPSPYDVGQGFHSGFADFIYDFFNYGLFRAATPTLSVISGYLLFSSYQLSHYPALVYKKFRTILLPAILWSTGMTFLLFAAQRMGLIERHIFNLADGNILAFADAIFGINHLPFNGPIYFLYDLFLCILASPLIYFLIRMAPWSGALLVVVLWLSGGSSALWVRGDILVGFYIGGVLSFYKVDLAISRGRALLVTCVFLACCMALAAHAMRVPPAEIDKTIALELDILRIIGPIAMWSYATLISHTAVAKSLTKFGGMALFIFCSHEPLVRLLGRGFFGVAQQSAPAYYPFFYVFAAAAVILFAVAAKAVLLRVSPSALAVLSGGRLGGGRSMRQVAAGVTAAPGPGAS